MIEQEIEACGSCPAYYEAVANLNISHCELDGGPYGIDDSSEVHADCPLRQDPVLLVLS